MSRNLQGPADLAARHRLDILAAKLETRRPSARVLWRTGKVEEAWAALDKGCLPLHAWAFALGMQKDAFEAFRNAVEIAHDSRRLRPEKMEQAFLELAAMAYRKGMLEDTELYAGEALMLRKRPAMLLARSALGYLMGYRQMMEKNRAHLGMPPLPEDEGEASLIIAEELKGRGIESIAGLIAEAALKNALDRKNGDRAVVAARILSHCEAQRENYKEAARWALSVARRTGLAEDWKRVGRLGLEAQALEIARDAFRQAGYSKGEMLVEIASGDFTTAAGKAKHSLQRAELLALVDPEAARREVEGESGSRVEALREILNHLVGDGGAELPEKNEEAAGNPSPPEVSFPEKVASLSILDQLREAAEDTSWQQENVIVRPSTYIEGVPGAGKSSELGRSTKDDLVGGLFPDQILAITLTRNGAKVFTQRNGEDVPGRTNHGAMYHLGNIAARIDGSKRIRVAPPDKALSIMEQAIVEKRRLGPAFRALDAEEVLEAFNRTREMMLPMKSLRPCYITVCLRYMEILQADNLQDFPGIMANVLHLLRTSEGLQEYVSKLRLKVDEYQDYDRLDVAVMCELIRLSKAGVDIAASPSQSIYGFRSASWPVAEQAIPEDAHRMELLENKRSTSNIVGAALPLAGRDCEKMFSNRGEGAKVRVVNAISTPLQSDYVAKQVGGWIQQGCAPKDIAILARTRKLLYPIMDTLRIREIDFQLDGEKEDVFDTEVVRGFAGFIQLALVPQNDSVLETVIDIPRNGFGNRTRFQVRADRTLTWTDLERVHGDPPPKLHLGARERIAYMLQLRELLPAVAREKSLPVKDRVDTILGHTRIPDWLMAEGDWQTLHGLQHVVDAAVEFGTLPEYLAYLQEEIRRPQSESGVTLSTIHAAKGREWKNVVVTNVEDGKLPLEGQDLDEERRLAFVGYTRAMDELVVTSPGEAKPSPFLLHIPQEVRENVPYP